MSGRPTASPAVTRRPTRWTAMRARVLLAAMGMAVLLASCEDEGNPGDDNLLTGASLVVVLIIVAVVVWLVMARRRR